MSTSVSNPSGPGYMPTQDPLAQLRDIHMPEPVSWWPPAPGWWLLALFIMALIATVVVYWRRYRARNAYRRTARRDLLNLYLGWKNKHDDKYFIEQTQLILRRAALSGYSRKEIAALSGQDWVNWLNSSLKNSAADVDFSPLGTELYTSAPFNADIPKLYQTALHWLAKHRSQRGDEHA